MKNSYRVVSAGTSFSNTPESDQQPLVMHDVDIVEPDGTNVTVRIMASDPGAAIDRVKGLSDEAIAALPRVPSA